jgi:hypothetical protein
MDKFLCENYLHLPCYEHFLVLYRSERADQRAI